MTKIALLSDIHGNTTALEAVLADARQLGVDEYWLLGDILMPGTGRKIFSDDRGLADYDSSSGKLGREFMASCSSKIRYK